MHQSNSIAWMAAIGQESAMHDALDIRPAKALDAQAIAAIYAHHVRHGTASFDTEPRSVAYSLQQKGRHICVAIAV